MNDKTGFETRVFELIHQLLSGSAERLAGLGLRASLIGPKRPAGNTISGYESEFEVRFCNDEKDLIDILEFHLFLNGQPIASLPEIEKWFRENLEDVMKRRRAMVTKNS